ncbi:MAG: ribbon-helix-helix protein, CopG family [Proteobacteria bacterium]|nr:ribbon-helix-helix protein, CopG family [Pseudomonadota bacterium]
MIRTQVQVEENQMDWLKSKAKERGISISKIFRESVDLYRKREDRLPEKKRERALSAVGRFASGKSDVSINHDDYLADAIAEK